MNLAIQQISLNDYIWGLTKHILTSMICGINDNSLNNVKTLHEMIHHKTKIKLL